MNRKPFVTLLWACAVTLVSAGCSADTLQDGADVEPTVDASASDVVPDGSPTGDDAKGGDAAIDAGTDAADTGVVPPDGQADDALSQVDGDSDAGADATGGDGDGAAGDDAVPDSGQVSPTCAGLDCDDGQQCTKDACSNGACTHLAEAATCSDGNVCTQGDVCSSGACQAGGQINCSDENPCTDDGCDPTSGCTHADAAAGSPCPAGVCSAGTCAPKGPCDGEKDGKECADGSKCSVDDQCKTGFCVGTKISCDDSNGCTSDACDPNTGCVNKPTIAPCSDGDNCTQGDICSAGACSPGQLNCSDGDACTDDACVDKMCAHAATKNGAVCDDGDGCTEQDGCQSGKCAPGKAKLCDDGNPCTADKCAPASGACGHTATAGKACEDGNPCLMNGKCDASAKCNGTLANCDDGELCTVDSCATGGKCVHDAPKSPFVCAPHAICKGAATTSKCADSSVGWAKHVSASGDHTCAIKGCAKTGACAASADVRCWGAGASGQLGHGVATASSNKPVGTLAPAATALTAGTSHTCALAQDGYVWCWGSNNLAQLGQDNSKPTDLKPHKVLRIGAIALESSVALAAGANHTCAVQASGSVHCWGANEHGQLGRGGTWKSSELAELVDKLPKMKSVAASAATTCALTSEGAAWCWGANDNGQAGVGKAGSAVLKPTAIDFNPQASAALKFVQLAGGDAQFCGLTSGHALYCWGAGSAGQLGNGSALDAPKPQKLSFSAHVVTFDVGGSTGCLAQAGGQVFCWGAGGAGQNGSKTKTNSLLPVALPSGASVFHALAVGAAHACGVRPDGGVMCWGDNTKGQHGSGMGVVNDHVPQLVVGSAG